MKKLVLFFGLLISTGLFAQVTNQGKPLSWKLSPNEKAMQSYLLPSFNLKALQAEDAINDLDKSGPWRFGYKHMVNIGFEDGQWTELENGDRIWRMKFSSPGALSMNVIFDKFFMPEGGTLYLYNDDRSDLLGAYTSIQNQESGTLGTWIVKGDVLWVEYFEPAKVRGEGKLHFESITHAYRDANTNNTEKGLGDSGDCNHDVDCPIGSDFEVYRDNDKKAVAKILSGGDDWCTGALINNTANDGTPYFLTANHCVEGQDPSNWSFLFGWISPNPVCASSTASTNGPTTMSISGATLRAKNAASDFCLVELNSAVPAGWNRTWAGWDRTDTNPEYEVGIHHPAGDIMKISRDDTGAIKTTYSGADVWEITAAGNGWELGVTEGGSSGSPLFDQNGRIIGQLWRGNAACAGTDDNNDFDQYGRFATSWDYGSTDATKLEPWLDPLGTNPEILDSYPPLTTYELDASVSASFPELECGTSTAAPTITVRNAGETTLTSATVTWNFNMGSDTVINWTGSLEQNESEEILLDDQVLISGDNTIEVTISSPNGGTDENTTNDVSMALYVNNSFNTIQVHLHLLTDQYCEETSWEFRDASGAVLYSAGPYTQDTEDEMDFYYDFDVVNNNCYTFEIFDVYSDGICCAYGEGVYELTTDTDVMIATNGNFGASEATEFAVSNNIGQESNTLENVSIYPNPTEGLLNIQLPVSAHAYAYSMTNAIGQVVTGGTLNDNKSVIDLSDLNEGIYFIRIVNTITNNYKVEKIVVSK